MITALENSLGYHFKNREYALQALSHSSYANEKKLGHLGCNERLEFLGDSVLGFVVADYLYRNHPESAEGVLSKTRSDLVCATNLAAIAKSISLGEYLRLGVGARKGGEAERDSVLEDAMESLLAAVYLDGGLEAARQVIYRLILNHSPADASDNDNKTRLQELIQRDSAAKLTYTLLDSSGPEHQKMFHTAVYLNGVLIGEGTGPSKKKSEQAAAGQALLHYKE